MEGIQVVTESIIVKLERGITEEEPDNASCSVKEEQENAEAGDTNMLQVKMEQEEDEIPLPASVTLHPIKEEPHDASLTEDPLQIVRCEKPFPVEEEKFVPSKEEACDGEDANDLAELPQVYEDAQTARPASGSRRPAKTLGERAKRPFKCIECGSSLSGKAHLIIHMRTHTSERRYVCDVCGKSFAQHLALVGHIRTHTGERPYKCHVCGKSFVQQSGLVVHVRTHSGDRPYKCDVCGKTFSQHNSIVRHMRTHTGERPYMCDVCGKSVSQKENLARHMQTHVSDVS